MSVVQLKNEWHPKAPLTARRTVKPRHRALLASCCHAEMRAAPCCIALLRSHATHTGQESAASWHQHLDESGILLGCLEELPDSIGPIGYRELAPLVAGRRQGVCSPSGHLRSQIVKCKMHQSTEGMRCPAEMSPQLQRCRSSMPWCSAC